MHSGISASLHQLTLGGALQAGPVPSAAVVSLDASGDQGSPSSTPTSSASGSGGAASVRPTSGKGSRGPRPRLFKKNACQADGCSADLSGLPRYNQRNHVCLQHKVADGFLRLGVQVRFCQRCGVAHPLADFDGLKKSCRRQLAVHNSRRRKASAAAPTAEAAAEAPAAPAPRLEPPAAPPAPPAVVPQAAESLPPLPMEADLAPVQAPPAAAASGASLGASPSVSVGSAMSDAGPDSWLLLADSDSGGGGGGVAWDEGDAELAAALGLSPLELAAPIAAPADERVCGATDERVCGVCCAPTACRGCDAGVDAAGGSGAAGLAAAPVRAGGAADGAAGRSGCLGGAAVAPEQPASGPPSRSGDAAGAGPASSGLLGVTSPAAAAEAAEAAAEAPAGSPAAVAALEQLQQGNAALYHVFVQQQLLAAQALITTAGALLNRQLPLMRSGSTASVCSVATC